MMMSHHQLHTLFHIMLRLTRIKTRFKNLKTVLMYINKESRKNVEDFQLSSTLKLQSNVSKTTFEGMPVYRINESSTSETTILYFHGGAFINEPLPQHLSLVDQIAHQTQASIIFPLYPRLPHFNEEQCLSLLQNYVQALLKEYPNQKFILMGDSAGGWIALSLAIYLRNTLNYRCEHMFLFSPWCDLSMHEYDNLLETKDPILSHEGLKQIGKMWMSEHSDSSKKGYRSDDDLSNIGHIHIFVGSHEIFLSQTRALSQHALTQEVSVNHMEYEMMIHDFVLFPFKESKAVIEYVSQNIKAL